MRLAAEDIARFQALHKEQFGTDISREDAYEQGIKLLRLMSIVYKPMTRSEFDRIQEHRQSTLPLLEKRLAE